MPLDRVHLWIYLQDVREVADLVLFRLSEVRDLSTRWQRAKDVETAQLARQSASGDLDDAVFTAAIRERLQIQFHYWAALEAFLAGWARLSLLLHPVDKNSSRGAELRQAAGPAAEDILGDRSLRDAWMHFDERLDCAIADGSFKERYRFVRSVDAHRVSDDAILTIEADSMTVWYSTREGTRAKVALTALERGVSALRASLG